MKLYNKKRAADGWWRVGLGILWIIAVSMLVNSIVSGYYDEI